MRCTKFAYILKGNGMKAMPIHSDLMLGEIQEYIRKRSKKIHKDGRDVVFRFGVTEFINPEIMMVDDYVDFLPALLGVK